MAIIGIETLVYGVSDVAQCARFFEDFGLVRDNPDGVGSVSFTLPEGSHVVLRHNADPSLPSSGMEGDGVREVIWGVNDAAARDLLVQSLRSDREVQMDADGTARFVTDFGVAMGLRMFNRRPVVTAAEPANSPGNVKRMNQHRKWRRRAYPKVISHVVFASPDYEQAGAFMQERLGFRLTDSQQGFGRYLRADGSNAHHNILLLNANAPIPGMDGKLRFHHANFAVEDVDEIMVGANYMHRKGWEASHVGLGRHRIDSALFYYIPCPAGGEAEYGADSDVVDNGWVPRNWTNPLFAYASFTSNIPPFLQQEPEWTFDYINEHNGSS